MNPLERMGEIAKIVNDGISKADFVAAFKAVVDAVNETRESLKKEVAQLFFSYETKAIKSIQDKLAQVRDGYTPIKGKDYNDGLPGYSPVKGKDYFDGVPGRTPIAGVDFRLPQDGSPDTGNQIVEKINKADSLIDKSAIEGLADLEKTVAEKTGNTYRVGWGAHPLQIQGLGVVIDKNTRVINFTGAGLTSVTRSPQGVVTVAISGGGGSSGTAVSEEIPTDTGDHTNFTIAHTPLSGTFALFRGGAKQASIGTSPDYSRTGTALALTIPLDVADGEVLICAYRY